MISAEGARQVIERWAAELGVAMAFKQRSRAARLFPSRGVWLEGRLQRRAALADFARRLEPSQDFELRLERCEISRRAQFWVARFELHVAWREAATMRAHSAVVRARATLTERRGELVRLTVLAIDEAPVARVEGGGAKTLVFTIATHPDSGLDDLQRSCRALGIDLVVMDKGAPWLGSCHNKLKKLGRFLRNNSYAHVLYTDGYDSVFVKPLAEIMRRYEAENTPLLMSAERNCFPAAPGYGPGDYPPAPTPYRFLNAGGFIGRTSHLLEAFDRLDIEDIGDEGSDQAWWTGVFVDKRVEMKLDHHCQIFQCLHAASGDVALDDGFPNLVTGSRPCIIHGNGHVPMSAYVERALGIRGAAVLRRRLMQQAREWRLI